MKKYDLEEAAISVILPVYNAEKTLANTIETVLKQSYINFELIVINDGSTDNSLNVIKNYSHDKRVKILSQENRGANAARKLGVENASKTYITFIDADDSIDKNGLYKMINEIDDNDILITRAKFNSILDQKNYLLFTLDHLLPKELWGKLFKKIIFDQRIMNLSRYFTVGEDFIWNLRLANHINKVKVIKDNYYNYQDLNSLSLMKSFKKDIQYEEKFYTVLEDSLRDMKFDEKEIDLVLSTQRFYSFFGIIRDIPVMDYSSSFFKKVARRNPFLINKINIILFIIMSIPNLKIKVMLMNWYIKVRKLNVE